MVEVCVGDCLVVGVKKFGWCCVCVLAEVFDCLNFFIWMHFGLVSGVGEGLVFFVLCVAVSPFVVLGLVVERRFS